MGQVERRDSWDTAPDAARRTRQLANCFWCGLLHRAEHPLSICPTCAERFSTMRLLEMSGSFPLTSEAIDDVLMRMSPGNYALGYMADDVFEVFYMDGTGRFQRVQSCRRSRRYALPFACFWTTARVRKMMVLPVRPAGRDDGHATSRHVAFVHVDRHVSSCRFIRGVERIH